jgi:hypothetical protein
MSFADTVGSLSFAVEDVARTLPEDDERRAKLLEMAMALAEAGGRRHYPARHRS